MGQSNPVAKPFSERAHALSTRAVYAALILSRFGLPEYQLFHLDSEPDRQQLRALGRKGFLPVAFFGLTQDGNLETELSESLGIWAEKDRETLLRDARAEFLTGVAAMRLHQPAN